MDIRHGRYWDDTQRCSRHDARETKYKRLLFYFHSSDLQLWYKIIYKVVSPSVLVAVRRGSEEVGMPRRWRL